MGLFDRWKSRSGIGDAELTKALEEYGRLSFLDEADPENRELEILFGIGTDLSEALGGHEQVAERLGQAASTSWQRIGAWRLYRDLPGSPMPPGGQESRELLDAALDAYAELAVTNLSIHVDAYENARWLERFGHSPPSGGSWGPPEFGV